MRPRTDPSELDKVDQEWQDADDAFRKMFEINADDQKELDKAFDAQLRQEVFDMTLRRWEDIVKEEK